MFAEEEFQDRMQRVEQLTAELTRQADHPIAQSAAELLRTLNELHAAGFERMLAMIEAGEASGRPLLEKLAQDDLIRSLLLVHGLHPVSLRQRLIESIDELRPLIESYGGSVSVGEIDREGVTLHLHVPAAAAGPSPVGMLQDLLQNAVLVAAPDVAEVRFRDAPEPVGDRHDVKQEELLPIITLP